MASKSHNAGQRGGSKGKYNPSGYNKDKYDTGYNQARGQRHGSKNTYSNSNSSSRGRKEYDRGWSSGYKNYINNNDSSCFIATACYGNCDAPEVLVLRQFRDEKLRKTFAGNLFIRIYYFISPFFARQISKSDILKNNIRHYLLKPIVIKLQRNKKSGE